MYDNTTTNKEGIQCLGTIPVADNLWEIIHYLADNADPQKGWLCPRCDRINAPQVLQCTCHPHQGIQMNSTGTTANYSFSVSREE